MPSGASTAPYALALGQPDDLAQLDGDRPTDLGQAFAAGVDQAGCW